VNVHDYRRFCDVVLSFRTKANLCRFVNVHDYRRFWDVVLSFSKQTVKKIWAYLLSLWKTTHHHKKRR
jgi:hypothetical protein